MMGATPANRRERKKLATREGIAATARRLFVERGFDAVTITEIAVAADVAEKTVYNHFATKDDLAFPGRREDLNRLLAEIAKRAPGASVLDVFRARTNAMLDDLTAGADDDLVALSKIVGASQALRERLTTGWEMESAALTAVIAESAGAEDGDVVAAVVARTLSWTHRTILRAALTGLLAEEDRNGLAARLRLTAARAYDQLAGGLEDYGRAADNGPA